MNKPRKDKNEGRRRFLSGAAAIAAAGTALTGNEVLAAASTSTPAMPFLPSDVSSLSLLRDYQSARVSSYDRKGGNTDFRSIPPGGTVELLNTNGPASITHIWLAMLSSEEFHLKKLVLRAFWDDEKEPSVQAPVGDFFGLALGEYFLYRSSLTSVAPIKALNAYFPMPFAKSGRITVTNEGTEEVGGIWHNIDLIRMPSLPSQSGYFHAQYRQAAPCRGWTNDWQSEYVPAINNKANPNGEGNYVLLEATGRGHFIGATQGVLQNQAGWWGEGDEMIFIDGEAQPSINGTGSEDYYNGAWDFGGIGGAVAYDYPQIGVPFIADAERIGGRYCLYRWHTEGPITFKKSIKVTMEHGHANHRSDNFYSTAYWYQTEPHAPFPSLPPAENRVPRLFAVGGPGPRPVPEER